MGTHSGRVAIITGAGRGIGQAIAALLADRGAAVVLVDLADCAQTASMIAGESLFVQADVTLEQDWAEIAKAVVEHHGRADIVVNNAGIYPNATIDELDAQLWRKTMALNLDAHFYSAKAFVPVMRRNNWGRFVNISSNSIGHVAPGLSHYMASKMGVIGFVRGLANDLAADNITVNAILPAITNTPGLRDIPDSVVQPVWQSQAIKRFADPSDIAGPVAFLTSDDAAFMTGQALVVDGGQYKIS